MRVLQTAVAVVELITVTASHAPAQLQDSVSRIGAALARLHPDSRIRVHTQQGWIDGRVESSSSSLVILRVGAETRTDLPAAHIDSVLIHHSGAGKGALTGALVLGIPTAILAGSIVASNVIEAPPSNAVDVFEAGVLGFFVGAVPGALLGAIIGSTSHHWSLAAP